MRNKKSILFSGGSSYSDEYQAVLDHAETEGYVLPTGQQDIQNNNAINELKSLGLWSTVDAFYRFIYDDVLLDDFSRINWVTATTDLNITGTPEYTVDGWKTDDELNRLTPTWKFNTISNFVQNDGFFAIRKDVFENAISFGVNATSKSIYTQFRQTRWDVVSGATASVGGTVMAASDGALGSATVHLYHNGLEYDDIVNDETVITTSQPYILTAFNVTSFSSEEMQGLIIGGNGTLAKASASEIDTILKSFI